ncbi:MAG: PKD domain-containing protein, partial [Kiritimatiellae bacterium]|nr:PKD domain-containing protein [Kiritimatiellia bacterium]
VATDCGAYEYGATASTIAYSGSVFYENLANSGAIDNSTPVVISLLGTGTFSGADGVFDPSKISVVNIPAGLVAAFEKTSSTTLNVFLTNSASSHAVSDSVTNMTFILQNSAFTSGDASTFAKVTNSQMEVLFNDPSAKRLEYSSSAFNEHSANDGTVVGAITITAYSTSLTGTNGEDFVDSAKIIVSNIPSGLSAVVSRLDEFHLFAVLTGSALPHSSPENVTNLTFTFQDSAFLDNNATSVSNSGYSAMTVSFSDPVIAYSALMLMEYIDNDGTIDGTVDITLVGDTYTGSIGANLYPVDVSVDNVPSGLSPVVEKISDTSVELSFTGSADSSDIANNATNVTITFSNSAFIGNHAEVVTNAVTSDFSILFRNAAGDPPIAYASATNTVQGAYRKQILLPSDIATTTNIPSIYDYTLVSAPSQGKLEYTTSSFDTNYIDVALGIKINHAAWNAAEYSWFYTATNMMFDGVDSFEWVVENLAGTSMPAVVDITISTNSTVPYLMVSSFPNVIAGSVSVPMYVYVGDFDIPQKISLILDVAPNKGVLRDLYGIVIPTNELSFSAVNVSSLRRMDFRYTPNVDVTNGTDFVKYRFTDGVSVSPVYSNSFAIIMNSAPSVTTPVTNSVVENSVRNVISLSYTDDPYQPHVFTILTATTNGLLESYDGTNYVTMGVGSNTPFSHLFYTPDSSVLGVDHFAWDVSDPYGTSGVAEVMINITTNHAPVVVDQQYSLSVNTTKLFILSASDVDSGQSISYVVDSLPAHGILEDNSHSPVSIGVLPSALCYYTPDPGYIGQDSFTWHASDGEVDSRTATCSFVVSPIIDSGRVAESRSTLIKRIAIVVDWTLQPKLESEISRLKIDLENEGYSVVIHPWNNDFGTDIMLWEYLRSLYISSESLNGAIFIGDMPVGVGEYISSYSQGSTDLSYWNMTTSYGDTPTIKDIWVSRFSGVWTKYGQEHILIKRALDANHAYRTGKSRLSHTAVFTQGSDVVGFLPNQTGGVENAGMIWPDVIENRIGKALSGPAEILHLAGHGVGLNWADVSAGTIMNYGVQARVTALALTHGIISYNEGKIRSELSLELVSRGGGCVLNMADSDYVDTTWSFKNIVFLQPGTSEAPSFRSLLAAGETWGDASLLAWPFLGKHPMFFGDLSLKIMPAPANIAPVVTNLTADVTNGAAPLTVTFETSGYDPDGNISRYDVYLDGADSGIYDPTYSSASGGSFSHTYMVPHIYDVQVVAVDNYMAYGFTNVEVRVAPQAGKPIRVNAGFNSNLDNATYIETYHRGDDKIGGDGRLWLYQQPYREGTWGCLSRVAGYLSWIPITAGTSDQFLFQYWETQATNSFVEYMFPLASGDYTVNLGFSDTGTTTNERLMDVYFNAQLVETGLDIVAEAGGIRIALEKSWSTTVTNGMLNLSIYPTPGSAKGPVVSTIEIIPDGWTNNRPVPSISADVESGIAPLTVNFTGGATDPDMDPVTYLWSFDSGSWSTNQNPSNTFMNAGTYDVTLTVTDGDLLTQTNVTIVVGVENQPPAASIVAAPLSGVAPLSVDFSAVGID